MIKTEITGETFVNAFDGQYGKNYSIQLSKKNKEGNWENGYIGAQFKKDVEVIGGSKINIKNAWLSFYKSKDNRYVPYVFINDFEVVQSSTTTSAGFMQVPTTSDLPF